MTTFETLRRIACLGAAALAALPAAPAASTAEATPAAAPTPCLYLPMDGAPWLAFPATGVTVTPRGTPVPDEGRRGKALAFNTAGAALELKGAHLIDPQQGTIAFWMRPLTEYSAGKTRHYVLTMLSSANPECGHYAGLYEGGAFFFQTRKDGAWIDAHFDFTWWNKPTWTTGAWYHVAITWAPAKPVTFFVNGDKVFEQKNGDHSFASGDAPIDRIVVGANSTGANPADAALDDLAVYRDVLTAVQIKALMANGPGDPATFVAYTTVAPPPVPKAAAPVRHGNLVENPGFEDPSGKGWHLNNWWRGPNGEQNECETAADTNRPHSGRYCQRITLSKHIGQDIQFQHKLSGLSRGAAYEVRFWTRGTANSKPISVWVLKNSAPYTKYMHGNVSCSEEWTATILRVVVPKYAPADDMGIWFCMSEDGTFWLDDVSVQALPAVEAGEPLTGNRVANGSFETGHDKWYAFIHGPGGRYEDNAAAREEIIRRRASTFEIVEAPDAPQGRKVLHWWTSKLVGMDLTSAKFHLRYGHPVTVAFWAKTGPKAGGKNIWFTLGSGEYGNVVNLVRESIQTTDTAWHRYTYTVTPAPSGDGLYFLEFAPAGWNSDFYLDAVTVTEGDRAPILTPADFRGAGWERVDDAHPGNLYDQGEKADFRIPVYGDPNRSDVTLTGQVVDAWERPVARESVTVRLARGAGETTVSLPSDRFGAFKCELYWPGETAKPAVEVVYSVVPRLTPLKTVKDSFFGGHVDLTPYNLSMAEKAGFRWLRYHGPADTKWQVVQPEPPAPGHDGFVFQGTNTDWIAGTKRAYDMGFTLFGTFGKVPAWAEDKPADAHSPGGFASYPPKDVSAWDRYVVETVKAFSPYIRTWEMWNEADAGFLITRPGEDKEAIYLSLARRTREAVEKAGFDVTLVGPAAADVSRTFTRDILRKGVTRDFDVLSFHCYGQGNLATILSERKQWPVFQNRKGHPIECWQSEGGITSTDIHTWLKTSGNVITDPTMMAHDAAGTVQLLTILKAVGVKKNFHYHADAAPCGRLVYRNEWMNMIDLNGIPFSPLAAHAAAVYFLEDTRPVGYDKRTVGGATLTDCRFTKNGRRLDVIWSGGPINLQKAMQAVGATPRQVFDMMANPMPVDAAATLTFAPVYLLE